MISITFNYSDFDEREEIKDLLSQHKHVSILNEFEAYMRSQIKHADLHPKALELAELWRENFYEILKGHGVEL